MEKLKSAYWKGNVRELENVIEFMINMMGENGILDLETKQLAAKALGIGIATLFEYSRHLR